MINSVSHLWLFISYVPSSMFFSLIVLLSFDVFTIADVMNLTDSIDNHLHSKKKRQLS